MSPDHDYEAVWRDAGPTLWRAVRAYAGGREDVADDAVAEAFARAIARGDDVRDPVAYLYRVAFRVAAAELKRLAGANGTGTAEALAMIAEDGSDVWRTLLALPPDQRAVLYLFYRADLPVKDVARLMGTSGAAVRMQLVRGRRRLAIVMREYER
ncbi:MAG: sigma-70 family RNA polymerase sigma factor [Actinobacteria bacterium]|nr:sigma-70 family RNA polymerase sigma factor [Actinomycetota bacterium]